MQLQYSRRYVNVRGIGISPLGTQKWTHTNKLNCIFFTKKKEEIQEKKGKLFNRRCKKKETPKKKKKKKKHLIDLNCIPYTKINPKWIIDFKCELQSYRVLGKKDKNL